MSAWSRIKGWIKRKDIPAAVPISEPTKTDKTQLREFVYLDEVSLRSLLSSLTGGVTEGSSIQSSNTLEAELASSIGTNVPLSANAEISSRFQTTNSSTIETARKATVQSWFRDLHAFSGLRLIEPQKQVRQAKNIDEILVEKNKSLAIRSEALVRGELIEFKVQLATDPVYHMSTLVSEFSGMVDDYPELFGDLSDFGEAQRINKILERLLAGLIPIRATAVDYRVVEIESKQIVVHKGLIQSLDIESKPLHIVGVTEHLAYWKDLRRVLFSAADFTLLGRIGRSGLQETWTPVKAAEIFESISPGIIDQINTAGQVPFGNNGTVSTNQTAVKMSVALETYAESLQAHLDIVLNDTQKDSVRKEIENVSDRFNSVSSQTTAFVRVREKICEYAQSKVTADQDSELRENARTTSGLPLFPILEPNFISTRASQEPGAILPEQQCLLDIEIMAIYW